MKKILGVIIGIICIGAIVFCVYKITTRDNEGGQAGNSTQEQSTEQPQNGGNSNKTINNTEQKVIATLEDEIEDNSVWCGTLQLIWNDLKNEVAKQDVVFDPQTKMAENLNKETFTTKDISEAAYYKKMGKATYALKSEMEKAIKDKFNETSDILDLFDWSEKEEEEARSILYVMLKKEFQFEKEFEDLGEGEFNGQDGVKYFGIEENDSYEVRNQVEVLYYNSKDDFSIKLKTKQNDEVIICKNPEGKTFNEIYKNTVEKEEKYEGSHYLKDGENLKIPNINIDQKSDFEDISNKAFETADGEKIVISKAIQTIKFELDRKGGKIKSEAGIGFETTAAVTEPVEKRQFIVDDTFAIFLIEDDKDVPYFAAKISNAKLFQ